MSESMKKAIKVFLDKGYLINPDLINKSDIDIDFLNENLETNESGELLVFTKSKLDELLQIKEEKEKGEIKPLVEEESKPKRFPVKVIKSVDKVLDKIEVSDFVMHYQKRYDALKKILQSRTDLMASLSISRILQKREKSNVSTIGLVFEKNYTKNNNLILTIEDNTGSISVLINNTKKELFERCKDIVLDEVIGVSGASGDKIIFANDVFFPDIPKNIPIKKGKEDICFAIISDLHVGSGNFLEEDFLKFISWLNGETGSTEQRETAKKVKYLFIVGDLVDNVGVYPGQEKTQNIKDIKVQYDTLANFLNKIRKDIQIIISSGNHDAVRLSEPQPPHDKNLASSLYSFENVTMVSNPSIVNIGFNESFSGFDILLYHGSSYPTYSNTVESIRFSGDNVSDRTHKIMKFLLQKRHLAPSHGSSLFIPDPEVDDLVIDLVPDFFISGHIHKTIVSQYGKITMVAGSCWQSVTDHQIKVGHDPTPGRVPIVNLKTRETKILKFSD